MTSRVARQRFSITKAISDSILEQLKVEFGHELAVEFYPEKPEGYRLNHTNGALLLQYGKSNYPKHDDSSAVVQPREMTFKVIIVSRHLHERCGAVPIVDWVCDALQGFTPAHCDRPLSVLSDYFISHGAGLWLYGIDVSTNSERVQALDVPDI